MARLTIRVEACTEILAVLILMAWADGKLQEPEKESIRSAAKVLNLTKELRERLETLLTNPVPLSELLLSNLGGKDRSFAYVAAAWLSGVDEDVDAKEQDKLAELQQALELDDDRAKELRSLASELSKPKKDAWADELVALFNAIPVRLEASAEDELEVAFE